MKILLSSLLILCINRYRELKTLPTKQSLNLMKLTLIKLYSLFLLTFIFTSCEYEAQLSYKVSNNTTDTIKVLSINTESLTAPDTFLISPNKQTTIAINAQGLSRVNKYKEEDEKLRSFSKMDIFKSDSIKSVTDFLFTKHWIYNENDKYRAEYILTVSEIDF